MLAGESWGARGKCRSSVGLTFSSTFHFVYSISGHATLKGFYLTGVSPSIQRCCSDNCLFVYMNAPIQLAIFVFWGIFLCFDEVVFCRLSNMSY